jgi:hypothetical protein
MKLTVSHFPVLYCVKQQLDRELVPFAKYFSAFIKMLKREITHFYVSHFFAMIENNCTGTD